MQTFRQISQRRSECAFVDSPCRFYGSDLKILNPPKIISAIPRNGFVTCTAGENASTLVSDPVAVFEVLSPSTAGETDRITKAREYQAMPSVQRYVMIEQDRIGATVYTRASGDLETSNPDRGFHSRPAGDRR